MGLRSSHKNRIASLVALVLFACAEPAPSPERAVDAARKAIDRAEIVRAQSIIDNALKEHGDRDSEAVWTLRVMRGEALLMQSQMPEALQELRADPPPQFARSEPAVQRLIYLGYAGRQPQLLENARTIAAQHQPAMLAEVLRTQAMVSGDEKLAREAISLARKHGRRGIEVKAKATLAMILASQQRFAEAIEVAEPALATASELGLAYSVQNLEGNLGWAYFELGDYETAAELFTRAEATATRIGNTSNRVVWLIQLGNIQFQKRDYAGASRYNRLAVTAGATGKDLGYALANLARAAFEEGRFDEARSLNAQALQAKRAVNDEEAELSSKIVEARIATAKERDYARAETLLREVIRESAKNRLEAESQLAGVYARSGRTELALAQYQRAVALAREERKSIADRDLRFAFFNTAAEMFDEYVDVLVDANRVDEALAVTEISRVESLAEGTGHNAPRAVDARAVARANDAVILAWWLGRHRSWLWEINAQQTKLHRLPPDSVIEKAVTAYRDDLLGVRGTLKSSGASGESLFRMLVGPANVPRGARVMAIADGALHTLNFETLVVPTPQRYWIEDVTITNASSLRLLARRSSQEPASPAMLLVGNAPSPDRTFPALRHAAAEMRAIEKRFASPKVLEGPRATPSAYRAASPGTFDYLHFVAHGVATRKRPLDSAVILARDARSYKLLARDVVDVPLRARLVTISSCHGAGTRTYAGEGVVGLAWAFLRAGADQVVASLWEIDDAATPQLMDEMYRGIRAGSEPAVALRQAKLTLLRSSGAAKKPRYWAPFVLYAGG